MKPVRQIRFWSNIFFLVPLALALVNQMYWYSVVIGLVFVVSSYFHFSDEKKWEYVDVTTSSLLIITNFTLLFMGHWVMPWSILAFPIGAFVALWFYYRQFKNKDAYNVNHGLWHIVSALVSLLCIITLLAYGASF